MNIRLYQLDAFTDTLFGGNPAAVCPLNSWLPDEVLQNIALENNLAETAFYIPIQDGYHIRWFTPTVEVDLCGHATLASAYVLYEHEAYSDSLIHFQSRSGLLIVKKDEDYLTLDFPIDKITEVDRTDDLLNCFNYLPSKIFKGKTDYLFVFENEEQVSNINPELNKIKTLDARGVIITARGNSVDFVSRFFAPQCGIDEDPVTGSAHTTLTGYWFDVLKKDLFSAIQLSKRKGFLKCRYLNQRVEISGKVKLYMQGEIYL